MSFVCFCSYQVTEEHKRMHVEACCKNLNRKSNFYSMLGSTKFNQVEAIKEYKSKSRVIKHLSGTLAFESCIKLIQNHTKGLFERRARAVVLDPFNACYSVSRLKF
jgi:hypothetical protein